MPFAMSGDCNWRIEPGVAQAGLDLAGATDRALGRDLELAPRPDRAIVGTPKPVRAWRYTPLLNFANWLAWAS